ncbi:hypothetical protein TNCV_1863971 [Trichonephila clavipes]|nr:hypothetical protein TNCV_1863971 [Trichonephila clavipes]
MKSEQREEWKKAMSSEIETMHNRVVWHLEKLPEGKNPIGCRWVYTVKRKENGEIARFKARLVAQGFKQAPFTWAKTAGNMPDRIRFVPVYTTTRYLAGTKYRSKFRTLFRLGTSGIDRVQYFVRGGFVSHRSRASSKHLYSHLPVDGVRFLGGQKGLRCSCKMHVWVSSSPKISTAAGSGYVTALALSYRTFLLRKV